MTNIQTIIQQVPEWRGQSVSFTPIAEGITNSNFKVTTNQGVFFVSLAGQGLEALGVNWHNKYTSNQICGDAGISPKVTHYFPDHAAIILEFLPIKTASTTSLENSGARNRLIQSIKRMHSLTPFSREFDMYAQFVAYTKTMQTEGWAFPQNFRDLEQKIAAIGGVLAPHRKTLVPSHNDLIPENILDDGEQVFIIDFDYSGNNDPCFDLGNIVNEARYADADVPGLAATYFGEATAGHVGRIFLQAIVGNLGWAIWSLIQAEISEIDFDFHHYGAGYWQRATEQITSQDFEKWLADTKMQATP